jgi:hypothetical protein
MDAATFNVLFHYTERLTRDPDDRDELVLMAWKESQTLGTRNSIALMINHMKLRSREMHKRCIFGAKVSGKSCRDAWNHERISLQRPSPHDGTTLQDNLASYSYNPLGMCIVRDFEAALPHAERQMADYLIGGYTDTDIMRGLKLNRRQFWELKQRVRERALQYLV